MVPTSENPDILILREGSQEEVEACLQGRSEPLDEASALLLLANPNCDWSTLRVIEESAALMGRHSVQMEVVRHRSTPSALAFKLIPLLYWKEQIMQRLCSTWLWKHPGSACQLISPSPPP